MCQNLGQAMPCRVFICKYSASAEPIVIVMMMMIKKKKNMTMMMMMMMMIGNLANINLSTVDCIESSDLLGKILTSYHRQKLLSHLEYLVDAGCQVISGFSSSFFSTEINQAFISLREENDT